MAYDGYGMPRMDFSILGDLGNVYRESQDRATLASLGERLASGEIDHREAAGLAARANKLDMSLSLLRLGQQQSADADFDRRNFGIDPLTALGATYGSGTNPAPGQTAAPGQIAAPGQSTPATSSRPVAAPRGTPSPLSPAPMGPMPAADDPTMTISPRQVALANAPDSTQPPPRAFTAGGMPIYSQDELNPMDQQASPAAIVAQQLPAQTGQPITLPEARSNSGPQQQTASPAQPAPSQAGTSGLTARQLQLMRDASNSNLSESRRGMAKMLLDRELKESASTDDMREHARIVGEYQARGQRPPTLEDWILTKRRAGATAITNDMRGENAEAAARGKAAGERAAETMAAASRATRNLQRYSQVQSLFDQIEQGKLEPAKMTVAAWGRALGLDDAAIARLGLNPTAPGVGQALSALVSEMAINKLGPGGFPSANFSNADLQFLVGTLPRLANEPQANRLIIEAAKRVDQINLAKAKAWREFNRKNPRGSFDDFEVEWSDRMANVNVFADLQQQAESVVGAESLRGSVVPDALRSRSPQEQLDAAPAGSVATIRGQRMEKGPDGQWKPLQ